MSNSNITDIFLDLSKIDISKLSPQEREEVGLFLEKEAIKRAQKNFYSFVLLFGPLRVDGFEDGRHIEVIAEELQELAEKMWGKTGLTQRKQISLPPGGMKSELCSRLFPAWVLGRWPHARILVVGHSIDFAKDEFGAKVRDIIRMPEYQRVFPDTELREDKQTTGRFLTKANGELFCTSLDAKNAGRRCHLCIVDDALVEEDALSKPVRNSMNAKYKPNIRSRILTRPDGAELLVGCLTADTDILMADGSCRKINLVQSGDLIQTYSQGRMEIKPVVKQWSVGMDDVYELITQNGVPIRGNAKHPFLLKSGEYVPLSELKPGDEIVFRRYQEGGERKYDPELMWLLGFMFGDGWVTIAPRKRGGLRYYTCYSYGEYPELDVRALAAFKKYFNDTPKKCEAASQYRSYKKSTALAFRDMEFVGKAHTKIIPEWVFTTDIESREAFLAGFVDADGWYTKEGARRVSSCNLNLVEGVKRLAISCGYSVGKVSIRTRTSQPPMSPKPVVSTECYISISRDRIDDLFGVTKVKSVTLLPEKEEVFDMEVQANHNFIANRLVVHNTRWCVGDLFDYLENEDKKSGAPWKIIKIPALLDQETSDYLRRKDDPEIGPDGMPYLKPGSSFWPEFQSTKKLEMLRGSYTNDMSRWNSVYMQNPIPDSGQLISPDDFKHWTYDSPPECHTVIVTLDTAYTKGTQSDYSAYQVWGLFKNTDTGMQTSAILLDAKKGKWEFPELVNICLDLYNSSKYHVDYLLIEERSSGLALIPELRNRGLPVEAWKSEKDKMLRMQAAAPLVKSGKFYIPLPPSRADVREKVMEFVKAIVIFPAGSHDDEADAFSQLVIHLRDRNLLTGEGYIRQATPDLDDEDDNDAPITYSGALLRRR